jgi:hypothetical protein
LDWPVVIDRTSTRRAPSRIDRASQLQARDSRDCKRAVTRFRGHGHGRNVAFATVDGSGTDLGLNNARGSIMGIEKIKADTKETMRNVDNKAKETWRKADGNESPSDKLANAGDDVRDTLGNAGDEMRRGAEDAREERDRDFEDRPI